MCVCVCVCAHVQCPDMWQEVTWPVAFSSREEWKRPDKLAKLQPARQCDPSGETGRDSLSANVKFISLSVFSPHLFIVSTSFQALSQHAFPFNQQRISSHFIYCHCYCVKSSFHVV